MATADIATLLPSFSKTRADILITGYIKQNKAVNTNNIPSELYTLIIKFYLNALPEFICFNCSIDYETGIVKSPQSPKCSYIISREPCTKNEILLIKFQYLCQLFTSAFGIIDQSILNNVNLDELVSSSNFILDYSSSDQQICYYGSNSNLNIIDMKIDLKSDKTMIYFAHNLSYRLADIVIPSNRKHHIVINWVSKNDTGKFQFVHFDTE